MNLPDAMEQRYEVLGEVGRGGMGVVYKARDRQTNEVVALKVLNPSLAEDQSFTERFKNELRLARRITHRNVCRIYDINFAGETSYISMEFIDGETLRALLKRVSSLNIETALRMSIQICAALEESHRQGIIHRDLKPENVMINGAGEIKVLDFGIARSIDGNTTVGQIVGSPAYMAPEQIQGSAVDQRVDIHALGLVMYEMLTGMPAYATEGDIHALLERLQKLPIPARRIEPKIPDAIEEIIMRCLEKDPADRFQTIEDIRKNIEAFRDSMVKNSTLRTVLPRTSRFLMRSKVAKRWLVFAEFGYIAIYCSALYNIDSVATVLDRDLGVFARTIVPWVIVAAMCGIAIRIYLLSALLLDHPGLPAKFPRLFPVMFILDSIWAASPILLLNKIHWAITLAFVVGLAYLPFAQRTLIENIVPENPLR